MLSRRSLICLFLPLLTWAAAPTLADESLPGRLDRRVRPKAQGLVLQLDPAAEGYSGLARFQLDVSEPVEGFSFHAHAMGLDRLELTGPEGLIPLTVESHSPAGLVTVRTEGQLSTGEYGFTVGFSNEYDTRATSMYKVALDADSYVFTDFEPTDARGAWPCWDEPEYKIPFEMTVRVPDGLEVVSNTPILTATTSGGWKTVQFARSKPMSTYLLAVAVGPFDHVPITGLSVPGRVLAVRGKAHLAQLAAEVTPPILVALEQYFGRPYPYAKLDLIAVPEFGPGAMENVGAVTFREDILLVDGDRGSVKERRRQILVIAHELAHMWFGNLVTMSWWDDLWLNESFANWLEYKVAADLFPHLGTDLILTHSNSLERDARPSTRAIRKPVHSAADVLEDLGLAYGKGEAVLAMVEQWLGEGAFRRGVVSYIERHAWGNARGADLWGALAEASGQDVSGLMASFLDQPGCPLVRVERGPGSSLVVTQERFLNYGVSADKQLWTVPVRLRYSDGVRVDSLTVLLSESSQEVVLGGISAPASEIEWVYPDGGALGYYRWSAPRDMLARLAEDGEAVLSARERLAFLDNAAALLDAGLMGADQYMAVLSSFAGDGEPQVVLGVIDEGLAKMRRTFATGELAGVYDDHVRRILRPALDRIGAESRPGEGSSVALLRPVLFQELGLAGDVEVRQRAGELAEQYLVDPSSVEASLVGPCLALAALAGDTRMVEVYTRAIESAPSPAHRDRLIQSLGAFRDPAAREAALDYVLSGALRPQELLTVPWMMGKFDPGYGDDVAGAWLASHYTDVAGEVPRFQVPYLVRVVAGRCSREQLGRARTWFGGAANQSVGSQRYLDKVSDSVEDCASLGERELDRVEAFLTVPGMPAGR